MEMDFPRERQQEWKSFVETNFIPKEKRTSEAEVQKFLDANNKAKAKSTQTKLFIQNRYDKLVEETQDILSAMVRLSSGDEKNRMTMELILKWRDFVRPLLPKEIQGKTSNDLLGYIETLKEKMDELLDEIRIETNWRDSGPSYKDKKGRQIIYGELDEEEEARSRATPESIQIVDQRREIANPKIAKLNEAWENLLKVRRKTEKHIQLLKQFEVLSDTSFTMDGESSSKRSRLECQMCFKKVNLSHCGGCMKAIYCSVECQSQDYVRHKNQCK
jgi:hypothetical protein